jgi:ectoine hydroxylase-related dioxygenase (phytanoyl-CoA dioxygenase family)
MVVSPEQVRQFEAEGLTTGLRIFDGEGADRVRTAFDALEAQEGREKCQVGLLDRHFDQRFVWDLATNPRILDAVESVMGPDILLLGSHFFCKYPEPGEGTRAERFVAWHQDVTYWGLDPAFAITAWYAVDDSDAENGCMRGIPGTHRDDIRAHGKSERKGNLLSINQESPVTREEEARAVDMPLKAGEISLHHGALVHGSNPNRSSRRRCGLTLRYIPTSVKQVALNSIGRRYRAILVRGKDEYRHFESLAEPFPR